MKKGRKPLLSDADINAIIEAVKLDPTITKREVAMKYEVSLTTLYRHLPEELKDYRNFPRSRTS